MRLHSRLNKLEAGLDLLARGHKSMRADLNLIEQRRRERETMMRSVAPKEFARLVAAQQQAEEIKQTVLARARYQPNHKAEGPLLCMLEEIFQKKRVIDQNLSQAERNQLDALNTEMKQLEAAIGKTMIWGMAGRS